MSTHLRPCPACQRHLRTNEIICPFCASSVPQAVRAARPATPPRRGMSRAALVAFSLLGAPACDDDGGDPPLEAGPQADAREASVDTPVYGAPPDAREAGQEASADAIDGPPPDGADAGADAADAPPPADAVEAGADHPVYGGPPPEAGVDAPVYGAPPDAS